MTAPTTPTERQAHEAWIAGCMERVTYTGIPDIKVMAHLRDAGLMTTGSSRAIADALLIDQLRRWWRFLNGQVPSARKLHRIAQLYCEAANRLDREQAKHQ